MDTGKSKRRRVVFWVGMLLLVRAHTTFVLPHYIQASKFQTKSGISTIFFQRRLTYRRNQRHILSYTLLLFPDVFHFFL